MMKMSQITGLSFTDLKNKIFNTEKEILEMRMKIRLGQEKNTAKKTKLRKELARLKTDYTKRVAEGRTEEDAEKGAEKKVPKEPAKKSVKKPVTRKKS